MQLVDNNCVLYPRDLEFRFIYLPDVPEISSLNTTGTLNDTNYTKLENNHKAQNFSVQEESTKDIEEINVNQPNITDTNITQNVTDTRTIYNDVNIITGKFKLKGF